MTSNPLPSSLPGTAAAARPHTDAIGVTGDKLMVATLLLSALAAVAIGASFGNLALAAVLAAVLVGTGLIAVAAASGTLASRLVLSLCLAASVALHIHLGRGTLEFHFGVFALLALVMVYRDWRPIVAVAGFFAVHHIGIDRLQAAGFGVYCTPEPNFLKIVMHASYLIVQTGLEIYLTLKLGRLAQSGEELSALMREVQAEGRLTLDVRHVAVRTAGATEMQKILYRIQEMLTQVRDSTASLSRAGTEIASGNQDLSLRTEQTTINLQQTAAAVAQLNGAVQHSAASAQQANALAVSAAQTATRGGDVVSQVVQTMSDINASSTKIAEITGLIDGIAFQTNILALNAAVEAARAGEQGRGFAVVASEVRSLAQRSAQAASEIKTLINSSVGKVAAGTRQVEDAGGTMREIVASVQRVSDMIAGITSAAAEQANGVGQVQSSVTALSHMTQQNVALVGQSAASAESLQQQTQRLADVAGAFKLDTAH